MSISSIHYDLQENDSKIFYFDNGSVFWDHPILPRRVTNPTILPQFASQSLGYINTLLYNSVE